MIQSPLLGYTAFSQLLHRHQQEHHHQASPMTSPMTSPSSLGMARGAAAVQGMQGAPGGPPSQGRGVPMPLGVPVHGVHTVPQFLASSLLQHLQHPQLPLSMSSMSSMARCPSPPSPGSLSSVSPSPSSSPPTSLGGLSSLGSLPSKSFTIDAILGLSAPPSHRDGAYLGHRGASHYMAEPPSSPTDLSLANSGRPLQQQLSPRRSASGPAGPDGDSGAGSASKKAAGGGGKCKRVRTIFTADQLERLEAEFERQQYMVGPERLYLAHALNLTEAQVKVWFQNRRIKWRKQHLEVEQQRLAAIKQHPVHHLQQHLDDGHGHAGHPGHPGHRDMDSGSEDSVLSEDRSYFASLVMPNGVPDVADDADASPAAARARLVSALVGPLDPDSPVGSPTTVSPLSSPGGHGEGGGHGGHGGHLGGEQHPAPSPGHGHPGHPGLAT